MANRRGLHIFFRHASVLLSDPATHHPLRGRLSRLHTLALPDPVRPKTLDPKSHNFLHNFDPISPHLYLNRRHFSSGGRGEDGDDDGDDDDEDDDEEDDEVEVGESSDGEECLGKGEYTEEEKAIEAAEIGYKVVGPLDPRDKVFKPYKPVFAVVQIGSHQFKVSNEDVIYTERLKFCEVNDKLVLNKVLLLGTRSKTNVGRPILPDATVHAVVEEHALDAKVIIFKKKRRKNYRRTNGHRQELTRLRITGIEGLQMKGRSAVPELGNAAGKKQTKIAVAA